MHLGEIMACSAKQALAYTEKLLVAIPRERFARFACCGGQCIPSNHPSFILGHLSIYGPRILSDLHLPSGALETPESFSAVYSKDAKCIDDPTASIYPCMEEVVEFYFESYRITIEALRSVANETYDQPNPNTGAAARFPTLGAMHTFYLGGHMMMHLGQLSAWRRAEGLPPA